MNALEQKEKCMKCKYARAVHTNRETGARIAFIGCECPPYKGKWTAEIKECPKINKAD